MPAVSRVDLAYSDTAYLAFGSPTSGAATQATTTLFDGYTLLGSNTSNFGAIGGIPFYFFWTNFGSNFNSPQATFIDASGLIDRSIQGRLIVNFDGDFSFERSFLYIGAGNGFNGTIATEGGNAPILTGVSVVSVPVPTALWLLGSSLLGLIGVAQLKRK